MRPAASMRGGPARNEVAFFGHDRHEPTIVKRITAIGDAGWSVRGFLFVRHRTDHVAPDVPCTLVDLGATVDRHYLRRLPALLTGLMRALRHRRALRSARVVYARNLDMALVAWLACRLSGGRAAFVYEVLDIQRLVVGQGIVARAARALERFLLSRCAILVVSSPEFMTRYFTPVQAFAGRHYLLENKVSSRQLQHPGARPTYGQTAEPPWVIGWFGTLRCAHSLALLARIADRLGARVQIHIRGRLSREDIDPATFHETLATRPNMTFGGPYSNASEIGDLYRSVHFSWAIDYLDRGGNSDWLLPNRLYEGGLHGALALARADSATGRYVVLNDLGWSLPEPLDQSVAALLESLESGALLRRQHMIRCKPIHNFVDIDDTANLLIEALRHQAPARLQHASAT